MKNILHEKPDEAVSGRLLETSRFIKGEDVKNKKVLDIGCGFGWVELLGIKRGVKEIVGIEPTKQDIETARKFVRDKRVKFKVASAIELPFEDKYFDTVVCFEVIEHIPKGTEEKMFSEIRRVLKNNGVLYLSTPYNSFFATIFDPAWWLIGHRHYSQDRLRNYGEKNGFKVLDVYVKGGWGVIISSLNMYFSKWILKRRRLMEQYFISKENAEYKERNGFVNIFAKYKKVR